MQELLAKDIGLINEDAPGKALMSKDNKSLFGAVISHPSKCAAQTGPGEFLWLLKLSFGRPKIECVIYWDTWVNLASAAKHDGTADCPLVF